MTYTMGAMRVLRKCRCGDTIEVEWTVGVEHTDSDVGIRLDVWEADHATHLLPETRPSEKGDPMSVEPGEFIGRTFDHDSSPGRMTSV